MDVKALQRQMAHYNQWKQQLNSQLHRFERWNQDFGLVSREVSTHLQRARQLLQTDSFTIACVGEFSRGKTELINALLFGSHSSRILPSQPGRTTMCPTEIYADPQSPNCVRLLPIETRRTQASLQSFKRIPQKWVTIHFDPANPEQMNAALSQVSAHKLVSPEDASRLGFNPKELVSSSGQVSVPTWRHAMISLDHPLLKQGLRILDTPGLNALGNEPELTLKTLPDAQAILFMLAADSGVSNSDMAIWREHIQGLRDTRCTAVLVLLNKIDSLWDDFLSPDDSTANIERIRQETAELLELPEDQVVAVSAKQALLAKAGGRPALLQRSNFPQLELMLAECILRRQQQIVGHRLITNSRAMIASTHASLERRLRENEGELAQLRLGTDQELQSTLKQQRDDIRAQHHKYHKQALSLRTSQHLLERQRAALTAPVSSAQLEQRIAESHRQLARSWTTLGLTRAIADFFESVDDSISNLDREVERGNKVLKSIYERSEQIEAEVPLAGQQQLDIGARKRQLRQLRLRADQFRSSINTLLTGKSTLISRFISTLVQEVRTQFRGLNDEIEKWLEEALAPLFQSNQYQKQLLEHHMLRLTQLQDRRNTRDEQLEALERDVAQLRAALDQLTPLLLDLSGEPAQAPVASADILSLDAARRAQSQP